MKKDFVPFEILSFRVTVEEDKQDGLTSKAMVKVKIGDEVEHKVSDGDGPINALDKAIRKAIEPFYPEIKKVCLIDYHVIKAQNGKKGTDAVVEVFIIFSDGDKEWIKKGFSSNIIKASLIALVAGLKQVILERHSISAA